MFQAKKLLQGRYEAFGRTIEQNSQEDAEMLEEINGVLKQARILLVEHLVLKALGAYQHDKATGKDKINAQIRVWAWQSEIHGFAQRALADDIKCDKESGHLIRNAKCLIV